MSKKACYGCVYFNSRFYGGDNTCRRYPPRASKGGVGRWPTVGAKSFCGEYWQRDEAAIVRPHISGEELAEKIADYIRTGNP